MAIKLGEGLIGKCPHGVPAFAICRDCQQSQSQIDINTEYANDIERIRGKLPLQSAEVDHPTHYSRWVMEPVEFIAINNLSWWLANVIKYTMRYDAKDGLKDLYKARSYLDMKIREQEGIKRFWEKPVAEERKLNKEAR